MWRGTSFLVFALFSISAFGADATGPNLDIAGIKIGMGAKDGMAALKAVNPKANIILGTHKLQGFPSPVHPNAIADQTISGDNDGENIEVLFTMPPQHQLVWGITRTYSYIAKNRPSLENTLTALRAKYGPPSIPVDPDPRDTTKTLTWVFDADGKLLPKEKAMPLYMTCGQKLQSHFGNEDMVSFNYIQSGGAAQAECNSIILITASVQAAGITPGSSQLVVYNLTVRMNDGRIYAKAIEATRAYALRAAKTAESKEIDEVNKRGAPKL